MERRNPYLILGIPYGASREEATKAFARRTKSLRRLGAAGHSLHTDLTGALKEIEERPDHPDAAMSPYRVPADPAADLSTGPGVFAPPPETPPPETPPPEPPPEPPPPGSPAEAGLHALRTAAAHEYVRHLVRLRASRLGPPAP
jgi:hypothetical protein